MRKYYIEIESYRDDTSITGIKIIDQQTKNRRSRLAKTLKNVRLDFFLLEVNAFRQRLQCARDLGEASAKLLNLEIRDQLGLCGKNEKTR